MANKFFEQVEEELARKPEQKIAEKTEAPHTDAPADAQPTHLKEEQPVGTVTVSSTPDGADVSVDGNFSGNAPSTLKLTPGKHKIEVKLNGYKPWSRDMNVSSGSEVRLNANLEKQ